MTDVVEKKYLFHGAAELYCGDARDIMQGLDCNVIITDPPYESLNEHVRKGSTTRLVVRKNGTDKRKWFPTLDTQSIADLLLNGWHLPDTGAVYVFGDPKTICPIYAIRRAANILVWDKKRIGMGYNWRRMHEFIAYYPEKAHKLRNKGLGDILRVNPVQKKVHPTEKPVDLLRILIENSTDPGDLVIDPFMGSGSTGIAAIQTGRKFIGIEIDPDMFQIATERIAAAKPETKP